MFYSLNNNVYLVAGNVNSCIYDFNSKKLYSVNNALAHKLADVNQGKVKTDSIDDELKHIFDIFLELGILILTEKNITREIEEIRVKDCGFRFAWIEITNKCNLRCKHCYNESDVHCENSMSLDNFKSVVDSLLNIGVQKVQIIGGEPFFYKQRLKEMLDYIIGKFSVIEIFTNGTLITEDWFDYLACNNIHMALSVYSYKEDVHDSITGKQGSWASTNQTIKRLKQFGIPYRVCNVLMKDVDIGMRTTDLYELSNEKDIVRMSGRANFSLLSHDLIQKKLITKESFQNPIQKAFSARLLSGHNCFKDRLYISADMNIFPCVMERRFKHCVLQGNSTITFDDSIRDFNKDRVRECCGCEYRYACFDCRPNSLSGDIYEKPWYCTYDPAVGEWADVEEFILRLQTKWAK